MRVLFKAALAFAVAALLAGHWRPWSPRLRAEAAEIAAARQAAPHARAATALFRFGTD
jgi:hypothetical protein